jgi:NAD(P)-dependent dehydrogenase (short-subunit alcohol dehydrogenase family)
VVRDGARVVLVLPTVAASGAAELVPLCTAVEGIRVMAKAVARRWGGRRITVNTIEVDLAAFVGGDAAASAGSPAVAQLGTPALPPGSAVTDVAGLIEMLGSDAGAALTGALLVADRGTVMLP